MDYIAEKLGHPSAEVRGRALESLEFKWKYGLIRTEDLLQDRRVLKGLLGLLGLGDGPQTTAVALLLLRKMAAADTRLARGLLELGALQQLQATPIRTAPSSSHDAAPFIWIQPGIWPEELLPSVEALAQLLLGFEPQTSAQPTGSLQGSHVGPSVTAAAGGETEAGLSEQAAALRRSAGSAVSAGLGSDAAGSPPLAHTHLSGRSLGSAAGGSPGDAHFADMAGSGSSAAAAGVRGSLRSSLGGHHRSASTGSLWHSAAAGAAAASAGEAAGAGPGAYHVRGPAGPGSVAASGDTSLFDERLLRARARADWRQMEAAGASAAGVGVPLYSVDSSSGPPAGHLTLPVVPLSAADDQALFELNVRLQYSDDERLLLPALLELTGAVGVDMPAEALLSRPSILDNCLALVGSSRVSREVQQAAAAALLQLIKGLNQSLQTYQNPELAHSEYGDAAAAAAEAAATGKPVPTDLTSCLNPLSQAGSSEVGSTGSGPGASWPLAGFREAAKTLAAVQAPMLDPSCPSSYPRLALPDLGPDAVWKLPAGALQGAVVDLTAVVASICLQTTELLKHPERHYELLPLLDEALPLLAATLQHLQHSSEASQPADNKQQQQQQSGLQLSGDQRQQLQQHMQAVWRGLLAALSRALAACAAVGAADRAAAASASLAGGSSALTAAVAAVMTTVPPAAAGGAAGLAAGARADGGLCVWDLPTLNLLMLGLRWVNAAPQYWVTPSLVPASLSDTLAAAACDEALDLVLPQLRQAAHHMLQQLRPGALQALREAHAVPAAWEAGEEALRQLQSLKQQLHTLQQLTQHQQQHHQQQQQHEVLGVVLGWLDRLQAAFPGLGYAPRWDAKLLQGALHGLSLVAATCCESDTAGAVAPSADVQPAAGAAAAVSRGNTRPSTGERVAGFVVSLLRHHSPTVQQLVWQLLQSAVAAAAEHSSSRSSRSQPTAPGSPAIQLLLMPKVLECLVVEQLSRPNSKAAACTLLMGLLQHGGSSIAQQLLPWRPWICSCAGDTAGDALNEALTAYLSQGPDQPDQEGFWGGQLAGVLQDLFSAHGEVRRLAGRQLLQLMTAGCDMTQEELEDYTDDPFKGLLGNAPSSTAAAASGSSSSSSSRFLLPPDPLTDASANLAAAFSCQDVVNLLAVLANKGLAQELRRSAAEELLALSPDPHLLAVMVQQQHLDAIWQLCVPPDVDDSDEAAADPLRGLGLSSLAVGAGDPSGGIFDMQLPIAGLHLLAGLLARSTAALEFVTQQPDRLLQPLLPLVLHSLNSVRKAVGRVLALVVFGHAAQRWSGFDSAAAAAAELLDNQQQQEEEQQRMPLLPAGVEGVLLPAPFSQQFKFPFKVTWLPAEAQLDSAGAGGLTATAGAEIAGAGAADAVPAVQQRQQQQRALVRQLVEQQQILRAAASATMEGSQPNASGGSGGGAGNAAAIAAAVRTLLADCLPADLSHINQRVVAATAANLVLIDPSAVAARCLAAVAAASSHAECTQALWALQQQLGSTSWGLLAVLQHPSQSWLPALSRLLGTAPVTREDQQLWLLVLQLVERLLVASQAADSPGSIGSCSVATYTQLQLLLQRSLSVWLQQPAAAAAAPRPPLALAAGSNSWEALRAQPSSASAAAAVADALGLSGSSGPATAVAADSGSIDTTLAVSVSRQALSTLLVLIKAVKRDCSSAVGFYQQQQQQSAAGYHTIASNSSSSSSSSSAAVACYSMSALQPCDLIRLLCDCVVGVTEGVDYSCRVTASAMLCEVLGALQVVARTQPQATPSSTATCTAAAGEQQVVVATADAACAVTAGLPAAFLHLTEAWICRVLMPVAGRQLPGFTGKALVRQALRGLGFVVEGPLVCEREWTQMWADIGGTFWLSRLCRDREASTRLLALNLTAQLLHPGRTATQALITSNWPDCVHRLMRVSGDICEAFGVRAAALRGLAAAMVLPLDALQQKQQQQEEVPALPSVSNQQAVQQQQQHDEGQVAQLPAPSGTEGDQATEGAGSSSASAAQSPGSGAGAQQIQTAPARVKKLHGFGLASLLQAEVVWQQLLPQLLLKWQQQPPGLTAAAAVLAAVAAAAEPDGVGRQMLLIPGLAAAAVAVAAAAAGPSVSGMQRQSATSVAEPGSVAAVLQQQCDRLDAAAAALQLLALVSAPASSGGGLLPLPVSVQAVVQAAPAVAVRLMCSIGATLQAQQQAVNQASADSSSSNNATSAVVRGDAGAMVRLQQQQLTAFRVAAAALSATAGTWPESTSRQQLLPLLQTAGQASAHGHNNSAAGGGGCPGELLCAVAVVLAHPACCQDLRLACTQLLGLLLSDQQLAAAALGSTTAAAAAGGDEGPSAAGSGGVASQVEAMFVGAGSSSGSRDGEAIGAVLCRDLAGQLPSSMFLPSTLTDTSQPPSSTAAGAGVSSYNSKLTAVLGSTPAWAAAAAADSPGQLMVAPPEGLVVVFALQNLLGFSRPAKAAALGIGLHKLLVEAALSMAVAASGPAAVAVAGGSNAQGARRTRARWFNTAPSAPALPAAGVAGMAGVMAGPSKKGNTGSVAFGRGGGPDLPSFSAVAGVKRPSAAGGGGGAGTPPSTRGKGATAGSRKSSLSLRSAVKSKQKQHEQQEQVQEEQQQEQQAEQAVALGDCQLVEEPPQQQALQEEDTIQHAQQQQQQQKAVVPPAADEASQHVSQLQQQLRQQQDSSEQQMVSSPGAADRTAAPAAAAAAGDAGGLNKPQLQAACKQLNLRKLLMSAVLLRHLAHGCQDTQAALTADGMVDMVLKLWPLALQHTPLLLELTRLLANTLPSCYEARLAAATLPGPPVSPVCAGTTVSCLASLLVGQQLTPQLQQSPAAAGPAAGSSGSSAFATAAGTAAVVRAAAVVLLGYASTDDGAAMLVKAGASCLPELAKAVRACIVSARRESETHQQRQLNSERLAAVLQLLAVLAGRQEGQRAMMRATVAPVLLELCTEVLQLPQQQPAVAAALLLLRNLSFNPEMRTPLLANGALLSLLLAAAESLLAVLPAAERQQWQQRLTAADQELSAAAAELGCDCRPPKWDPLYETLGPGGGVGSGVGAGAATTAAKLAAGGSSSRPGSLLGLGAGGAAVPSAVGSVCCAVYAVSALWALVHNGEKVKAGLRKLPAASARLAVVKAYAEQLLQQQQQQAPGLQLTVGTGPGVEGDAVGGNPGQQQQLQKTSRLGLQRQQQQALGAAQKAEQNAADGQLTVVVGGGGAGVQQDGGSARGRVWVGTGSLCGEQSVGWWLQQLQDSSAALLDLMDAW